MAVLKELETTFLGVGQVRGFKFTQISMTKYGFLYEVNTGDRIYYEVFKKRINPRFSCVSYPTIRAFGIWAWTTPNKIRAYTIFKDLSE